MTGRLPACFFFAQWTRKRPLLLALYSSAALLSACSGLSAIEENDLFAPKAWQEAPSSLPAPPQAGQLIPFELLASSPMASAVDAGSISVGTDGVVRYTLVITSPSGARNVSFEGIRCATFEYRLYATLPAGGNRWAPSQETSWRPIQAVAHNNYRATLAKDYFCEGHAPTTDNVSGILAKLRNSQPIER